MLRLSAYLSLWRMTMECKGSWAGLHGICIMFSVAAFMLCLHELSLRCLAALPAKWQEIQADAQYPVRTWLRLSPRLENKVMISGDEGRSTGLAIGQMWHGILTLSQCVGQCQAEGRFMAEDARLLGYLATRHILAPVVLRAVALLASSRPRSAILRVRFCAGALHCTASEVTCAMTSKTIASSVWQAGSAKLDCPLLQSLRTYGNQ